MTDYHFKYVNQLLLTREGIVVYTWEAPPGPGIYLYKKDVLYRLSDASVVDGKSVSISLDTSYMSSPTVSPDGCRIAYQHSSLPATLTHAYTPRHLSIVDICRIAH